MNSVEEKDDGMLEIDGVELDEFEQEVLLALYQNTTKSWESKYYFSMNDKRYEWLILKGVVVVSHAGYYDMRDMVWVQATELGLQIGKKIYVLRQLTGRSTEWGG